MEKEKRIVYSFENETSIIVPKLINKFRKMNIKLPNIEFQRKLGKVNRLNRRRKQLFAEREKLIEKILITINEEEIMNG